MTAAPAAPWPARLRLAAAIALVGVATGAGVLLLVWVVHTIEHAVFGHAHGPFLDALAMPAPGRRFAAVSAAGVLAAFAWYALRRWGRPLVSVEQAVDGRTMPAATSVANALVQVGVVALGGSIGKELAPREVAATAASHVVRWLRLDRRWARVLVAAAAGAGLGAVYDVPLGGALFALEVLAVEVTAANVVVVTAVTAIAVLVARPLVPNAPLYTLGAVASSPSLLVAALPVGAVAGVVGLGFERLTTLAKRRRPAGARLLWVMPAAFVGVAALGLVAPLVLGNGRALAQAGFDLAAPAGVLLLLAVGKFVATAATIGSGAVGGTLQPSIAIGAAIGGAAAVGWDLIWPGASGTALAVVGAAAFLAATMQAPLTAAALVVELTGTGLSVLLPVLVGIVASYVATRVADPSSWRRPVDPGRE